ncbi:acyl-CoA N-acyltransferase [Karstenula rhodostoma CBS 690.94]|uniref:Acyl-CoA N-acyltransferase n=1 Tax=Karstenula rhodostoma CBS 690.94 TaxID=1392251 RepID=A0A9P4P880_9PLEO|nr:acyl-CoA N-acyltransferase [Karstenula rhodostoma CBS 690.94]
MSHYTLSPAAPEDSEAIASLFALSWQSPFTQLQLGDMSTDALSSTMAPRIVESMSKPGSEYVVMRAEDGTVSAVAHWSAPSTVTSDQDEESAEDKADRQEIWIQEYRKKLPEDSNKDLIVDFTVGLRELREQVLQGRQHFLLENIATHPAHRRRRLASKLIEWVFPRADEQDVLVYLDTASDNEAMRVYKRLGFEEKGSRVIEDLSKYGGEGSHMHVALVRMPGKDSMGDCTECIARV